MIAVRRLPLRAPAGATSAASADHAVTRAELLAALYLLAIINALAAIVLHSEHPFQALAGLLNLTTLAATAVGIYLLRQMPDAEVRRCDWVAATIAAALLLVPHQSASWLAVLGLALYMLGRDRRSVPAVAAASVFLLLAASSYWGAVLGQAFGSGWLTLDATLAAAVLDALVSGEVDHVGNLILAGDQTMLVTFWCSFVPNLLHAVLWYTVIARALRPEWQVTDLLALLGVAALVLTVNTLRLALMALSAHTYHWVHGPVGGNVFNVGLLLLIAAIALLAAAPATSRPGRGRGPARCGEPAR